MAEILGLVASVVQLAGAATTVSLALFECARTIKSMHSDINGIAADISDLSYVLEHLGEVLGRHKDKVITKTTETISRLIKRCDLVIEELKVTVELVKGKSARFQWLFRKPKTAEMRLSLEGFKSSLGLIIQTLMLAKSLDDDVDRSQKRVSANARRNIHMLRSAVVANKHIIQKLKDAEKESTADSVTKTAHFPPPVSADPKSQHSATAAPEDPINESKMLFNYELARALPSNKPPSSYQGLVMSSMLNSNTWETVLFRSYDNLSKQPPASETLSLAFPLTKTRASPSLLSSTGNPSKLKSNIYENYMNNILKNDAVIDDNTDADSEKDVFTLLEELTKTSEDTIRRYQNEVPEEVQENLKNVPDWVRKDYTFTGSDPSDPADWEPNPPKPPPAAIAPPIVRKAYDVTDADRKPLCDILADKGGSYVWSHFNGNQRDYFVGTLKVLEYHIKPDENKLDADKAIDRTIVSKQWISKDILDKGDYSYKEYGEGGFAIMRKLTPSEVNELHVSASNRTEQLFKRLAKSSPQTSQQNTQRAVSKQRAKALFDFSSDAAQSGELPFKKGNVLDIHETSEYWWEASLNGQSGRIPCNYVQMLDQAPPMPYRSESSNSIPKSTNSNDSYSKPTTPSTPSGNEQSTPHKQQQNTSYNDGIRVQGNDNVSAGTAADPDLSWKKTYKMFKSSVKSAWQEAKEENERLRNEKEPGKAPTGSAY